MSNPGGKFERAFEAAFNPQTIAEQAIAVHLEKRRIKVTRRRRRQVHAYVAALFASEEADLKLRLTKAELAHAELSPQERAEATIAADVDWARLVHDIPSRVSAALKSSMPSLVDAYVSLVRSRKTKVLRRARRQQAGFEGRLRRRWGSALAELEALRWLCLEEGIHLKNQRSRDEDLQMSLLFRLHARACQLAAEVLVLLKAGHADGAHARWRTMHETAVVTNLLAQDVGLAERYAAHEVVESLRIAKLYDRDQHALNVVPLKPGTIEELEGRVHELTGRYGKGFDQPYGWALPLAGPRDRLNMVFLEEKAGLAHWRSYYKMASHNVHAESKALMFQLGKMPGPNLLLAGPSDAGLAEAGQAAGITLAQITTVLLTREPTVDRLTAAQGILRLATENAELFVAIHNSQAEENRRATSHG